jgi:poly-gamma-glutamate synthase PgsB/CapB
MTADPAIRLLEHGLSPLQRRIEARRLRDLARAYAEWPAVKGERPSPQAAEIESSVLLVTFLRHRASEDLQTIFDLRALFTDFSRRQVWARTARDREAFILEFARGMGAQGRRLRSDQRALRRWFDFDAIVDRYRHRIGAVEQRLAFEIERLGAAAAAGLSRVADDAASARRYWTRFDLEDLLKRFIAYDGDVRVAAAAFGALAAALRAVPEAQREAVIAEDTLQTIYRAALDHRQDVWVQCTAAAMLADLSPAAFQSVAERRLATPQEGDDLFVRRRIVDLAAARLGRRPAWAEFLATAAADPSAFVRQAVAAASARIAGPGGRVLTERLAHRDPQRQVRAAALLALLPTLDDPARVAAASELLAAALRSETESFVLRVALKVACDGHDRLMAGRETLAREWRAGLLPAIADLRLSAAALPVRRWAASAAERFWCRGDSAAWRLHEILSLRIALTRRGRSLRLPKALFRGVDPDTVGRVLAVIAQADFGFDIAVGRFGYRIARGDRLRFRTWRLLHEWRHPATDKRQAFSHTTGRVYYGAWQAPSPILAELAQTKVPGEPLLMGEEASWRPYLPLVDQVLSAVDGGEPVSIFTADGVTRILPPKGFLRRLRARLALTWRFADYAQLRNWTSGSGLAPTGYLKSLAALGIDVRIRPHGAADRGPSAEALDPAVARFFPAVIPFFDPGLWERFQSYLFSVYQNTLKDLVIFLAGGVLLFFGRHVFVYQRLKWARRRIPLVLGGWGTRGKSGTERLKAAIMNAFGYGLVSKTTGCEAMFLYAPPFGRLREMFLFRPYDKATIWEQYNVAVLGRALRCDVFLWECMALNPTYVNLLQRHWMRDDIATITNTYPDHEDIQGPAGRDIPDVMVNFIPRNSTLITSEEQMLPVLAEGARRLNTRLIDVTWLEAGLLPDDILKRFPYEEHPYNIALVAAMAAELGIDADFALKEMADRVVPDLGVLKSYPVALLRTRRLEFVNGMSANERFGCISNWARMNFDRQDSVREPGVWLTTVVNNRADRVARSRVFAGVLVNDLAADRHFLIGSNLEGLQGFIKEAWAEYAPQLTLWPEAAGAPPPTDVLHGLAARFRLAWTDEQVRDRLRAMLAGQPESLPADDLAALAETPQALETALAERNVGAAARILAVLAELREQRDDLEALAGRIGTGNRAAVNDALRDLMGKWFQRKLVVIHDFFATGDQIIDRICEETPPGYLNRVMGIQNIKGTGLDFVYRWQAWQACHDHCVRLGASDALTVSRAAADLASFKEHGLLTEELVRGSVRAARASPAAQAAGVLPLLSVVEANLDKRLAEIKAAAAASGAQPTGGLAARLLLLLEAFQDSGDAVRRRRKANRIYRDMVRQQISLDRAVVELQELTKRQKGGWLAKDLRRYGDRLRDAYRRLRSRLSAAGTDR